MNRILTLLLALGFAYGASAQSNDARVEMLNGSSNNTVDIDQAGSGNTVGSATGPAGVLANYSNQNDVDIDQVGTTNSAFAEMGNPGGPWAASDRNLIKIDQDGTSNNASVRTVNDSDANDVDVRQDGSDNDTNLQTFNSSRNLVEVDQDGSDHTMVGRVTTGSDANDFQVDQDGTNHRTVIDIKTDSDRNGGTGAAGIFRVRQDGDSHLATMLIDGGDANGFDLRQTGLGHSIDANGSPWGTGDGITVTGNQNWTKVLQTGTSHSFSEAIVGNNNSVDVHQQD